MEIYHNVIDYLFGVYIYDRGDMLVIEDRRPTAGIFISLVGIACIVLFLLVSAALSLFGLGFDVWTGTGAFAGLIATFTVMFLFSLGGTLREVYTFDKANDTYRFTRRGIFRSDVLEGSASQFCGVRIDQRNTDEDSVYMVTLLLGGMLFGQSEAQPLREDPPIFNSYHREAKIAEAISRVISTKPIDNTGQ